MGATSANRGPRKGWSQATVSQGVDGRGVLHHHSTATAAAIPGVVLCVADGIVGLAAGIIRAAVRLSGGIDRLIGVTAGEEKRCDHDRDAEPHGRFPTHWSRPSFGRCAGEVGHHASVAGGGDLIEQRTLNFNSMRG
jgi:hypothetical protein